MKFENYEVYNLKNAILGMRNPMESYQKADSDYEMQLDGGFIFKLGKNDKILTSSLLKAGDEHSKFMRQILVSVDITAPRFWWVEMDTYKIGTTSNSCSTIHKLLNNKNPITLEQFEYCYEDEIYLKHIVDKLEEMRKDYISLINDKTISNKQFKLNRLLLRAKSILPESFLQKRTWTANYAVLRNIYKQRCENPHRLPQWLEFGNWIKELPLSEELIKL